MYEISFLFFFLSLDRARPLFMRSGTISPKVPSSHQVCMQSKNEKILWQMTTKKEELII